MEIIKSALFKLNKSDFIHSLITGVFVAFIGAVYQLTTTAGFDVFTADWGTIMHSTVNLFFISFVAKISEKTLTDENNVLHLGFAKIQK